MTAAVMALAWGWSVAAIQSGDMAGPPDSGSREMATEESELSGRVLRRVAQRALIDSYASRFHGVEEEREPQSFRPVPRYRGQDRSIRVVRPQLSAAVRRYRLQWDEEIEPLRGFRAPILDAAEDLRRVQLPEAGLSRKQREAADVVVEALESEGLLLTLTRCLSILGPHKFVSATEEALRELQDLGFPVDLLQHFQMTQGEAVGAAPVVAEVARRLMTGWTVDQLAPRLPEVPFVFRATNPEFFAVAETGEHEIGLLRMQLSSGYLDGVVRGGSLDVAGQLVAALPRADVLASVPDEWVENVRWLSLHCWPLARPGRFTIIGELVPPPAWAQDNGKAGWLGGIEHGEGVPATMTPRYASREEIRSTFAAGGSFVMDGLRAAGHVVLHSSLLFQGGNLMVVRDPARDCRLLFLAETELYRNRTLGLTEAQVLEAFRVEFGVDECVVFPAVSYHLDYDLTVRLHRGRLVAFVNDSRAAARIIVDRGIAAFERHAMLPMGEARKMRNHLWENHYALLIRDLAGLLAPFKNGNQEYRMALVERFTADPADSGIHNLQVFLGAMDFLASEVFQEISDSIDPHARAYLAALRDLESGARAQQAQLRSLGIRVVGIPSMPDMYRSLNYLNGLQDRHQYLMPAAGGFYAPLDSEAARVFREGLRGDVRVQPILTQGLQRQHGALHCVASVFPSGEVAPVK
jgi:hypothetical protein